MEFFMHESPKFFFIGIACHSLPVHRHGCGIPGFVWPPGEFPSLV
jgi:hypothetical protein